MHAEFSRLPEDEIQSLVTHALHPVAVDEFIFCCELLHRVLVLVPDQDAARAKLTDVRLDWVHCGWDICILTQAELESQIDGAVDEFSTFSSLSEVEANRLVGDGVLTLTDLAKVAPSALASVLEMPLKYAESIVREAQDRDD